MIPPIYKESIDPYVIVLYLSPFSIRLSLTSPLFQLRKWSSGRIVS
jgi:hypothetical protein